MELNNEFEVAMPVDDAWAVLTDIEKIAPCMPGAELREVEGDEYRGVVKVKVGPITASYKGVARFEELDAKAHKAVLKAEGRETRGQGNATALITATLTPSTKGTKVEVATDLAITGKVAQFGRGVLADVSGKLLDQFVHNLESTVLASPSGAEPASASAGSARAAGASASAGSAGSAGAAGSADAASAAGGAAASDDNQAVDSNGSAPAQPAGEEASAPARRSRAKASTATAPTAATEAKAGADTKTEGGDRSEPAAGHHGEPSAVPKSVPADSGPRQIVSPAAEPVDLLDVAGGSVMKRLAPYLTVAGILLIARIVFYSLRRRRQ